MKTDYNKWINNRFWFFAFITLVGLIAIIFLYLILQLNSENEKETYHEIRKTPDFTVKFSNQQFENLINESLKDSKIRAHITKEKIQFDINTKILVKKVKVKITTHPKKINNSNIEFNIESIQVGNLNISNPIILSQIKKHADLPQYIVINPKKERFNINLNKLDIENVNNIQIETLDVSNEKWYFDINLEK